jgi:hypothetical protein
VIGVSPGPDPIFTAGANIPSANEATRGVLIQARDSHTMCKSKMLSFHEKLPLSASVLTT